MNEHKLPEPWLRETLTEVPTLQRAALHALEQAKEDIERWCEPLSEEQLNARPLGLASVGFHVRHIAGSIDRLLTYAEGGVLSESQLVSLKAESKGQGSKAELLAELKTSLVNAAERITQFNPGDLNEKRLVGKKLLPTTLAGLLVHIADHTQRHVGQAIITAKVVVAAER